MEKCLNKNIVKDQKLKTCIATIQDTHSRDHTWEDLLFILKAIIFIMLR